MMIMQKKNIVVAVTGASGSIYAQRLLQHLERKMDELGRVEVVFSKNAFDVWKYELKNEDYTKLPFKINDRGDFFTGPASGSAGFDTMIICPASMGTLGRIAHGISDDLITRAADVMLKERRQLILIPREAPYNLIHLRNMTQLTEAGAVILPASPSFYSHPKSMDDLVDTVIHRILKIADLGHEGYKWKVD
jgi:4-hydroxy-3-polyprenylbenzoate decarboxylase